MPPPDGTAMNADERRKMETLLGVCPGSDRDEALQALRDSSGDVDMAAERLLQSAWPAAAAAARCAGAGAGDDRGWLAAPVGDSRRSADGRWRADPTFCDVKGKKAKKKEVRGGPARRSGTPDMPGPCLLS